MTTAGVEELVLAGFDSRLPEELEGSGTGLGVGAGSSCEELAGDVMEERLIAAVRKRICLYDVRDPDYRVNEKRLAAWEEIGQELGVGADKAKKEWEKLRRCFTNALHRRRQKRSLDESRAMPPWKYEEAMSFLMPSYKVKKMLNAQGQEEPGELAVYDPEPYLDHASLKSEEHSEDSDLEDHFVVHNSHCSSTVPMDASLKEGRKRRRSEEDIPMDEIPIPDCILRDSSPRRTLPLRQDDVRDMDETELFFLSLARTTKTLPPAQQARVKLLVSQAVFQAQMSSVEPVNLSLHKSNNS